MLNTETISHAAKNHMHGSAKPATLSELAEVEYERAGGDVAEAVAALSEIIAVNDDLRVTIAEQVIKEAASSAVRRRLMNERSTVMRHAVSGATRANVSALASGVARSILDFPLSNGVALRDATRAGLDRQIARYESMSSEMRKRASWLSMIAKRMGSAATVGDAIDDDEARRIYQSA